MALVATATGIGAGAKALGFDFGNITQPFTSLFGNNRGSKRERRDQLREALIGAGMKSSVLSQVHSDHVSDLENIVNWVSQEGQPAIDFLNRTKPAGTGADWDDIIIQKYERQRSSAVPAFTTQATGGNVTQGATQAGVNPLIWGLLAIVGIGFFFNRA